MKDEIVKKDFFLYLCIMIAILGYLFVTCFWFRKVISADSEY